MTERGKKYLSDILIAKVIYHLYSRFLPAFRQVGLRRNGYHMRVHSLERGNLGCARGKLL
jgi:hypothetical protein